MSFPSWVFVLLCSPVLADARGTEDDRSRQTEFFETKIRPVLVEHCYSCHAVDAERVRGGLLLDSREGTRTGGDSGPAVVPEWPAESLLLEALRYESFEMPPSGQLPRHVIDDFRTWIEGGAPDPRETPKSAATSPSTVIEIAAGRRFWSFQPLRQRVVPQTDRDHWCQTDIDRFLLAGIEAAGLEPAEDADRRALLRRASFDLLGLPPSRARIISFLTDESPTPVAFSRVVDELLESPHFGERWGRHWLDVARFAESTGGGRSLLYGTSWRYRDYVIGSFNADKAFDRFIVEQIAGDLLPSEDYQQQADQLTATAFLALGPTNYELQDKEQLRMDVIDEQIDTVGRAFLGMTLGCARCHDHKFDPIPTTDYYALAGIFRSTKTLIHDNVSRWVSRPLPVDPATQQRLDEHAASLAALRTKLEARIAETDMLSKRLPQWTLDDVDATVLVGDWKPSSVVKQFVGQGYRYADGPGNRLQYRLSLKRPGSYNVRVTYSPYHNRSPNALFTVTHRRGDSEVRLDQRKPPPIEGLYVSLGEDDFADEAVVTVHTDGASGTVIADAVQVVPVSLDDAPVHTTESSEVTDYDVVLRQLDSLEIQISDLKSQIVSLEEQAPPRPPDTVVVTDEDPSETGDYHVCIRGNPKNLGNTVPRGFLTVATAGPIPPILGESSGRLELARWIVNRDNPLTARVAANRIWYHLFGAGIVRTVDNFGSSGEPPSHPELLDYLANRFVEGGWSVKTLIREIMTSRAYRLSSEPEDGSLAVDPENRLLSHFNRRRLDAESICDSILALSGQLDPTIGGDTIRANTKDEYNYQFDVGRRAVYLPVFRNRLPDLFTVFDFPDPNLSTGRRTVSTLSTQALLFMNSPFVIEQAELAAKRLLTIKDVTTDQRITLFYNNALGRPPSAAEQHLAEDYLTDDAISDSEQQRQWAGLCQALMASVDFRYIH